jgi:hypothetical protein
MKILFYVKWILYWFDTYKERTMYQHALSKGYDCVNSYHDGSGIIFEYDRNAPPTRHYLNYLEYKVWYKDRNLPHNFKIGDTVSYKPDRWQYSLIPEPISEILANSEYRISGEIIGFDGKRSVWVKSDKCIDPFDKHPLPISINVSLLKKPVQA